MNKYNQCYMNALYTPCIYAKWNYSIIIIIIIQFITPLCSIKQ